MKILVIRFSSIGDIVLTTPVVRCLNRQKGAEVHYLTKKNFASILTPNPYISRVFAIEKDGKEVLPELVRENYDAVVDLHHNLRSLEIKLRLGKPATSFPKLNLEKWLLVRFGIDRLPRLHIVDRYLSTVQHLGVKNDGEGLDYFIPENEKINPQQLSPHLLPGQYIAFVLGATHATKRLPREKMLEICQNTPRPMALLGGKQEMETGQWLAEKAGDTVQNLCGKLSLHQSASMVQQAAQVLTHDTGFMHIAAAFSKRIISVWGNTIPEFGMYPYYPQGVDLNTSVEVQGLSCRPCSKIGFDRCPRGHFKCMQDIDTQYIVKLLNAHP